MLSVETRTDLSGIEIRKGNDAGFCKDPEKFLCSRAQATSNRLADDPPDDDVWLDLYKAINAALPRGNPNVVVAEREQIMLTSIDMEQFGDVSAWWADLQDIDRERAEEENPPAGSGWVRN